MIASPLPEPRGPGVPWGRILPIALLLAVGLALGLGLAPDYGQSTDEGANLIFARETLKSYQGARPYVDEAREDKGPFYLMVWLRAGEALGRVVPGWLFADGRHFTNFLTFQVAVLCVYALALRFVRPGAALASALLFETQPVLFGHAFINQKDTPFMAFFALTVVLGLAMVDRFVETGRRGSDQSGPGSVSPSIRGALDAAWAEDPRRARRATTVAALLGLVAPVLGVALLAPLRGAARSLVEAAYRGEAWGPVNVLFARWAEHAATVPVDAYVQRGNFLVTLGLATLCLLMIGLALVAAFRWWPRGAAAVADALRLEVRQGLRWRLPWMLVPAVVVLGMTVAIRSTGLYAGLLVAGYAFGRSGGRAMILLGVYFGVGALVTYALWPQLWGSPLELVVTSTARILQYPQPRRTLVEGAVLWSDSLPWWYLPWVLAIQITLPVSALIAGGSVVAGRSMATRPSQRSDAWVLLLWFLVPFLAVVLLGTPIYNYFRHVLFALPPLFVAAGVAVDGLLRRVRPPLLGSLLVAAGVLPGIVAIGRLHPYEYGYFNEVVGGVRGAYGRYLPDYWCTSIREAMAFVNAHAGPSAAIAVVDAPASNAVPFAREDLRIRADDEMVGERDFQPSLVVGCSYATVDPQFFPEAPVLWVVEREGVPLAIVKSLAAPLSEVPSGD